MINSSIIILSNKIIEGDIMSLSGRSLININDFSKDEWLEILNKAQRIKSQGTSAYRDVLKDKVIATLFFEPSTRTRLSFESAIQRSGGSVIGFSGSTHTSIEKGETLEDTIRMVSEYADLIIMRHPESGAASRAEIISNIPIINAGDGSNEHPTQTLLDMFSIRETQGRLDNLSIGFAGDLRYGRTVNSLVKALSDFKDNKFTLISPNQVSITEQLRKFLQQKNTHFTETSNMESQLNNLDILYMTRMQKERFEHTEDYLAIKDAYVFGAKQLQKTKNNFKILHPLPRVKEISTDIDNDPKNYCFKQAANGVPVRMALLSLILN